MTFKQDIASNPDARVRPDENSVTTASKTFVLILDSKFIKISVEATDILPASTENQGVEESSDEEKGEDKHAVMEAGIVDEEAPRGREALFPKARLTDRGASPVDEEEHSVVGEGGDMHERMDVE